MFPSADPTRRLPVYLQARTKENFVWQLKLLAAFSAVTWAYAYVNEKRVIAKYRSEHPTTD